MSAARDDRLTVVAIAALAICTTALAHEAFGHGGTCLALGGHITLLSNAFFRCSLPSALVAAGGPAGNLLIGLIAFALQAATPPRHSAWRLYALCVMAFSLFWEAGYMIFAMVHDSGDTVFAWRGFVGPTDWGIRIAGIVLGVALYIVFGRMLRSRARAFADTPGRVERLLRPAWATGVIVMAAAAALFAPDRWHAVHDAGLSAVAAFPMLWPYRRETPSSDATAPALVRDWRIVAIAIAATGLFAATMGRGVT